MILGIFAESVLRRVAQELSLPSFVEVTVESDATLDLSSFDITQHAGVLLDGVADMRTLVDNREELQGRPKVCMGGRSATMKFSYPYTLARRAIVVTADLGARNLHLLRTHHWLSDRRNVTLVWLQSCAWVESETEDISGALEDVPPRLQLRQWDVNELAAHVEAADAEGLASMLRKSSVNGADFADLDFAGFVDDLGFTRFAAKKLLALRDAFSLDAS